MSNGPNDVSIGGGREDGGAFSHTPGENKPPVPADEGKLAGKFNSVEDMEKAYLELQSEFSKARQGGSTDTSEETQPPTDDPNDNGTIASAKAKVEAAQAAAVEAGVDMDALNTEWRENGELSQDTYDRLKSKGLQPEFVDQFIAGQEALGRTAVATMAEAVGGSEELNAIREWAASGGISDREARAYDNALASGDFDTATTLLRGIASKRNEKLGTSGSPVRGQRGTGGDGTKAFSSRDAMVHAMQDPRYRTDPDYRAGVLARAELTS